MIAKRDPYYSRKLREAAKGQACIKCGSEYGVVGAHYQGIEAHKLGKGRGIKPTDVALAHLCTACHGEFDGYAKANDYERGFEFLMLCLLTVERLFKLGVVK